MCDYLELQIQIPVNTIVVATMYRRLSIKNLTREVPEVSLNAMQVATTTTTATTNMTTTTTTTEKGTNSTL